MSIIAKPFDEKEKIVRSIFDGDPSIFTAEDLNRQLDAIYCTLTRLQDRFSLIRVGWDCFIVETSNPGEGTYVYKATVAGREGELPYVYAKGVRFVITEGDYSCTVVECFPALYLIAKKVLITFSESPSMSGISSTEHNVALPSSDTWVYKDERLLLYGSISQPLPTLAAGEEIIGIVATGSLDIIYSESTPVKMKMLHLAMDFKEMYADVVFLGDFVAAGKVNDSLSDIVVLLIKRMKYYIGKYDLLVAKVNAISTLAPVGATLEIIGDASPSNLVLEESGAYKLATIVTVELFVSFVAVTAWNPITILPAGFRPRYTIRGFVQQQTSLGLVMPNVLEYKIETNGTVSFKTVLLPQMYFHGCLPSFLVP